MAGVLMEGLLLVGWAMSLRRGSRQCGETLAFPPSDLVLDKPI